MSFEIDIENINKHLSKAISKHPDFCSRITESESIVMRGIILENARRMAEKTNTAEYVLFEEISEIYEAYAKHEYNHAIDECYDAIAVLLRMVDKIRNEIYPWED